MVPRNPTTPPIDKGWRDRVDNMLATHTQDLSEMAIKQAVQEAVSKERTQYTDAQLLRIDAKFDGVNAQMAQTKKDLTSDIMGVKSDLKEDITTIKGDLKKLVWLVVGAIVAGVMQAIFTGRLG